MFGGLAVYLFERQMLLLVEPTKSGRWDWHGVSICTVLLEVDRPALSRRSWKDFCAAHPLARRPSGSNGFAGALYHAGGPDYGEPLWPVDRRHIELRSAARSGLGRRRG